MSQASGVGRRIKRSGFLLAASAMVLFWTGCQGALLTYKGAKVLDPNRIALVDGSQRSGRYESPDLTVDYTALKSGDELQLSGVAEYTPKIRHGYGSIAYFNLSALMADREGTVLQERAIMTPGSDDPLNRMRFSEKWQLPPGTASMAFSYTIEARGFEDREKSTFWGVPIVR